MFTSQWSLTHWWVAAIVSGMAVTWAVRSLVTGTRTRLVMAGGAALCSVGSLAVQAFDKGPRYALQVYVLAVLPLAVLRLVFARWVRRQVSTPSGERWDPLTRRQSVLFVAVWLLVVTGLVVLCGSSLTSPAA